MSKLILDLKRTQCGSKRWRCPQCNVLTKGDIYTLSKKTPDGSLFELIMCVMCASKRLFRKADVEKVQ